MTKKAITPGEAEISFDPVDVGDVTAKSKQQIRRQRAKEPTRAVNYKLPLELIERMEDFVLQKKRKIKEKYYVTDLVKEALTQYLDQASEKGFTWIQTTTPRHILTKKKGEE